MRKLIENNGVRVKGYAGSTGILLAMNIGDNRHPGLLGFATAPAPAQAKRRPLSMPPTPGQSLTSNQNH